MAQEIKVEGPDICIPPLLCKSNKEMV